MASHPRRLRPGDTARRLPGGQLFVPKPMQRILDVRTVVAKPETAAKGGGSRRPRDNGPEPQRPRPEHPWRACDRARGGLPRLGKTVAKGDVLAMIEHAIPAADRTTISERSGEIDQLIAIAEARLARLRPLAERGAVPQSQIIDVETELAGLRSGANCSVKPGLRPKCCARRSTASLRAPASWPAKSFRRRICCSRSSILRAFGSRPSTMARSILPRLKDATAVGGRWQADGRWSFKVSAGRCSSRRRIVQFSIVDPPPALRVGQPVTVTARSGEPVTGMIISRNAVVRGAQRRDDRVASRRARAVRGAAGSHRAVRRGERADRSRDVARGDRIVIRGAELINQIR